MICWEPEIVLKEKNFLLEEDTMISMFFFIITRTIIVYRDKALEITVIE